MINNPTDESRELFLYATNNSTLYFNHMKPVIEIVLLQPLSNWAGAFLMPSQDVPVRKIQK